MSDDAGEDDDGFLARWSRRKRAARDEGEPPPAVSEPEPEAEPEIDPATLPSLETLGADSDYTVFLKKGVPPALRLAALRKAWASDPAITGYKPLVDYDWDCNAPGYGALRPTDDARRIAGALFRHLREDPAETADGEEASTEVGGTPDRGAPCRPSGVAAPDAD